MANIVRLFCVHCNPQYLYRPDRRVVHSGPPGQVVDFPEQRNRSDRRRRRDRRVAADLPLGMEDRRAGTRGRRFCDGYAWFDGCIEEAVQAQWLVDGWDESADAEVPARVVCPTCRQKIR